MITKIVRTTIATVVLLGVFISCRDSMSNDTPIKFMTSEEIASIGRSHNASMDHTFAYIIAHKGSEKFTPQRILQLNQEAAIEYFNKTYSNLSKNDKEKAIGQMQKVSKKLGDSYLNSLNVKMKNGRIQDATQDLLDDVSSLATSGQKIQINKIFAAVTSLQGDLTALQSQFDVIETETYSLPLAEQTAVLTTISIARNASTYWDTNLEAWVNAVDPTGQYIPVDSRINRRVLWGWVAAADIGVGASMAIGASPALVLPWIGWGYYIGVTVGSSAIASGAAAAVTYFYVTSVATPPSGSYYLPE